MAQVFDSPANQPAPSSEIAVTPLVRKGRYRIAFETGAILKDDTGDERQFNSLEKAAFAALEYSLDNHVNQTWSIIPPDRWELDVMGFTLNRGKMNVSGGGAVAATGAAVIPDAAEWTNNFANLPDAQVGVFYSENLADYGINIAEVHAIGTNRSWNESDWPSGLTLDTATGILSGTPTIVDEVAVVTVVGVSGSFNGTSEWAYLSGLSGISTAVNFDTAQSVTDAQVAVSGNEALTSWDNTVDLFGTGSARMDLPDNGEYSDIPSGHTPGWIQGETSLTFPSVGGFTSTDVGNPFVDEMAVGDEVSIAVTMKIDRNEVLYDFLNESGDRFHSLKLYIFDNPADGTASANEVVSTTRWGTFMGYNGLGTGIVWSQAAATACSPTDFRDTPELNNGVNQLAGFDPGLPSGSGYGQPWTACQQARYQYGGLYSYQSVTSRPDGSPDPLMNNAGMIPFDWWFTIHFHIRRDTASTTFCECKVAPLGQDYTPLYSEVVATGGPYGLITLLNSHTSMMAEIGIRPAMQRWYGSVLTRIGAADIPAPGFTE